MILCCYFSLFYKEKNAIKRNKRQVVYLIYVASFSVIYYNKQRYEKERNVFLNRRQVKTSIVAILHLET